MTHRLLVLFSALLAPGLAVAQSSKPLPDFGLQRLQLEPSGLGSLVVGTGRTLDPGVVRVSVQAHYEHLPLNFARTWDPKLNVVSSVESKLTGHVTAAVGVLPWLQLGAQLPYIIVQRGNTFRSLPPPDGQGLDTPWVSVRAAPLQVKNGAPLNLAAELAAALPVGRAEILGRDTYAVNPKLQVGVQGEGFQAGAELGALLRPRYDLSPLTGREKDVVGSELRLGATVTSRGKNNSSTRPELSVLLNLPLQGGRPGGEVLVGVRRHTVKGLDLYFLGGPGLGTAVDMPFIRLLVGASFVTGEAD
ncbi:flagellar motor protein MotB [Archangium sp.]|uniref:flagellar motor protein MotB n=1 Tax=Archangium sp. TaxID=1872627 RepID=UPI002D273509|nr:flagellar motor protein MotB [Archangium sp.]HYO55257.1 flagellar motor protein MotB [Archangium sp.]